MLAEPLNHLHTELSALVGPDIYVGGPPLKVLYSFTISSTSAGANILVGGPS